MLNQKTLKMKNVTLLFSVFFLVGYAQETPQKAESNRYDANKFSQMYDLLATPTMFRTASGAPGPAYYQQQADYKIDLELDDKNTKLYGTETITYYNNSPESLEYLWIQLDQNIKSKNSKTPLINSKSFETANSPDNFVKKYLQEPFDGGFKIDYVKDGAGKSLPYIINETMMRIDLPQPLKKGEKISFSIHWWYNINDYHKEGGRSGYETVNGNNIYVMAQFYPRMAVYNDVEGWQNMQFWGQGEFALTFGNYEVNITVPADHIMEATGELQNRAEVFSPEQLKRYQQASQSFDKPIVIVTQTEAEAAEKGFATTKKTWKFKAQNVRDFGFASSRKFIYDAMAVKLETNTPMAISVYPKESNPLWGEYSTKVVAHTLKTYSKFTFDYPYPKAVSVSAEDQGMEYPMICWNYGRPDEKGYVSDRTKYGMMGVIIHEVGHNFFPMIVNSDERQWTWMDEGLNSFLQYQTEKAWDKNFPSRFGEPSKFVNYMKGNPQFLEPIMSNSEVIQGFSNNAYGKPAVGLNILRNVVMGPELFDFSFKTYANRWKFKHPTPEDFFRTMEDASAVDLDWFWRGWFYSTDYVDISIKQVKQYFATEKPTEKLKNQVQKANQTINNLGSIVCFIDPSQPDFNKALAKAFDKTNFESLQTYLAKNFTPEEQAKLKAPKYFYEVEFERLGGMLMPIVVELTFDDGTKETQIFPAQIWRKRNQTATRTFATEKPVVQITIDPELKTTDIDTQNNVWKKE